jgi:hypothetical protein
VFDDDRYLAYRLGEGEWNYANVMGHLGQEYGLGMYDDWHSMHRFIAWSGPMADDNDELEEDHVSPLQAVGALENLTLGPLTLLSPADAGCYIERYASTFHGGDYPLLLRITRQGKARPRYPVTAYIGLMELLIREVDRAEGRVASVDTALETPAGRLQLRYPATGEE